LTVLDMRLLRLTLLSFVCFFLPLVNLTAQDTRSAALRDESASFKIAEGSTFSASGSTDRAAKPRSPAVAAIVNDIDEAFEIVRQKFAASSKLNEELVVASSINRMLQELDPHSSYYTRQEFRELNDGHRGQYFGLGVSVSNFTKDGEIGAYVLSVTKGSPAERAGLKFGDRIVKVGDRDVRETDAISVRGLLRGPEGSMVTVIVERAGETLLQTFSARRAKVHQPSIPAAFMFDRGIGYIALTEGFNYTTAAEFNEALDRLKVQGMKSLIVDLRGNGGGIIEQAIMIAERFLPLGSVIVSQRGRYPLENRIWRSNSRKPETMPLVLLVDENTASASEIIAAAMQDNDRATIVGARTFGKGLVQDVVPLEDGSGIVLTSERYYAPSGRSIQREYSDSSLYDYFRHVSKGALIDKPSFASRTNKGRIVYGGDGIAPDIQIELPAWTPKDLREYEIAFFLAREGTALPADPDRANAQPYVRWFRALAGEGAAAAAKLALQIDPRMRTAISVLTALRSPLN
jgi:carboxyl-terminal processing protease